MSLGYQVSLAALRSKGDASSAATATVAAASRTAEATLCARLVHDTRSSQGLTEARAVGTAAATAGRPVLDGLAARAMGLVSTAKATALRARASGGRRGQRN